LLSNIIDELLDLSSLEQYEIPLKNEAFDISKLVEGLMERTKLVAKQKNLTSSYDIKTDHDIVIGDPKRLLRVFENIVNNSVIYSEKGNINLSMVENSIDEFNSEYKVVISDTGIGMSKEQLDRIFEKFYSVKTTKTYKTGGLGIGLNIAKGILDKMNASVEIESELGSGTVFTCKIPLKIVNSEGKKEKKEEIFLDLSDKKLLLVEDIEINVKIMVKMLSKTSINVVVAHNGKEALEMFKADDSFDIIFMDLQMPVMDGYEATRQIRAIDSDKAKSVPIIAVSANAFDKDIIRALNAGVNEHFAKPIGLDRMLELLKRYF
jgi:CheY-like chemotaxis protein